MVPFWAELFPNFSHYGSKRWTVHQGPAMLDCLFQHYGLWFFPLLIRPPRSPRATMAWAGTPHVTWHLWGPQRTSYAALESERNHGYTLNNAAQQKPHLEMGFFAGKAQLSVHQSQEDMGEVRAWQIQGIIRPLSSLQLSLTRLVGENEGDRREFMTYPCNHRGVFRHSEIKHMGRKKERMGEAWGN